jgi:hypothetical protein
MRPFVAVAPKPHSKQMSAALHCLARTCPTLGLTIREDLVRQILHLPERRRRLKVPVAAGARLLASKRGFVTTCSWILRIDSWSWWAEVVVVGGGARFRLLQRLCALGLVKSIMCTGLF